MAKKKKNNNQQLNIDNSYDSGFNTNVKTVIGTIVVVLLVFGCFYLLTLQMTAKGEKKEIAPASIGYKKILAGSIFDMDEKEYLVVLYDREDDTDITSAVSSYNNKNDVDAYYVDLKDGLNKSVVSDRMNTNVKDASNLEVKDPSLLKIKNKEIVESIDGKKEIIEYLSK